MSRKLTASATKNRADDTVQPDNMNVMVQGSARRTMRQPDLAKLLPDCCRIGFAAVDQYDVEERNALRTFLAKARAMPVPTVARAGARVRPAPSWKTISTEYAASSTCVRFAMREKKPRPSSNVNNAYGPLPSGGLHMRSSCPTHIKHHDRPFATWSNNHGEVGNSAT